MKKLCWGFMAPQAVMWCLRVVELASSLVRSSLHLSHTGSLKSFPGAYGELASSTGTCISHSLGWVCLMCFAAGASRHRAVWPKQQWEGRWKVDGVWCPYGGKKPHHSSWCSTCVFDYFFFPPCKGAEGEMVFPTEEAPFKSDNTTELFNSGQLLPLPCTGAFGARPHEGSSWPVGRALPRAPTSGVQT